MRILVTVLVISSLTLSGCGRLRESKANPGNWFGKNRAAPAAQTEAKQANPLIPENTSILKKKKAEVYLGTPVEQITSLVLEPTAGGAIIRVTGLSLRQGAFDVRLISDNEDEPVDGVLTYTLKALQPDNTPQGSQIARTINAAKFVSNQTLDKASTIRIIGAGNVQTKRR